MRALIQRVAQASVTVHASVVGAIGPGLLVLLGVGHSDSSTEVDLLVEKIVHLRIFSDIDGKFNLSLLDTGGAVLLVSQFTLYADARKGRRPSFVSAAAPDHAAPLVDAFAIALRAKGVVVERGVFGADMQVSLVNDGPVTILLDSEMFGMPRRST